MPLPDKFDDYDSNGDGLIYYEEFTHAVLSLHSLSDMDNLRPLFQTWDTNGRFFTLMRSDYPVIAGLV